MRLSLLLLAIGAATSSSVSNLFSVSSSSDDSQNLQENNTCIDDKLIHFQAMRSVDLCLRECTEFNVDDDGYLMNTDIEANASGKAENDKAQEWDRLSWPMITVVAVVWYLIFSSYELHQLVLFLSFLFVTGRFKDTDVVMSMFIGCLPYIFAVMFRSNDHDIDDVHFYDEEEKASFSVGWGGRTFEWAVRGPRDQF